VQHSVEMTVELEKDVEEFLRQQVSDRVCDDPSQLVNDVLRSLRDQQQKPFEITPELEAWLLESSAQPATPLTHADFEAIRTRVRVRSGSRTE
jgi:Arc/MetJ-type ribon-helix-helix transcriptional regulator